MNTHYEIKDGSLVGSTSEKATLTVYTDPDEADKQRLVQDLQMDWHGLESALDPDEISRVEFGPETIYIIWKRPKNVSFSQQLKFDVTSVGFFLRGSRMIFITEQSDSPFTAQEFQKVSSQNEVILKFFLVTVHHFLGHLKVVKQITAEIQIKLNISMENRYLLQMFALTESLIYYLNALEANSGVLAKLRANAAKMGFSEDELKKLDDIMIDHQQCLRQTQIYSSVLSGLMDARGNIINNNMNVLLKNLTLINIVFLPLNLIASIGGMSEFSMMTQGIHWKISYSVFLLAMAVLGWVTWILLVRKIDKGRQASLLNGRV